MTDQPEITILLEGLEPLEILKFESFLFARAEVASVERPDAPKQNPNATYSGTFSASAEVLRLVAQLHGPLLVAGAAGTAALSGFAAKVDSGLGDLVMQWLKDKIGGKDREVKATILGADGKVIRTITEKR